MRRWTKKKPVGEHCWIKRTPGVPWIGIVCKDGRVFYFIQEPYPIPEDGLMYLKIDDPYKEARHE